MEKLKDVIKTLVEKHGFRHLITITGLEANDSLELVYHLSRGGVILSVRVDVPEGKPVVPTITDVIPGAVLYEREVHDLLGVEFEGHPDLSPLLLPDDWPRGVHPLRGGREAT